MTLEGHEVIGHETIYVDGCFRKERYWLRGWVRGIKNGIVTYTKGWSGEETIVTVTTITPCVIFEVHDH